MDETQENLSSPLSKQNVDLVEKGLKRLRPSFTPTHSPTKRLKQSKPIIISVYNFNLTSNLVEKTFPILDEFQHTKDSIRKDIKSKALEEFLNEQSLGYSELSNKKSNLSPVRNTIGKAMDSLEKASVETGELPVFNKPLFTEETSNSGSTSINSPTPNSLKSLESRSEQNYPKYSTSQLSKMLFNSLQQIAKKEKSSRRPVPDFKRFSFTREMNKNLSSTQDEDQSKKKPVASLSRIKSIPKNNLSDIASVKELITSKEEIIKSAERKPKQEEKKKGRERPKKLRKQEPEEKGGINKSTKKKDIKPKGVKSLKSDISQLVIDKNHIEQIMNESMNIKIIVKRCNGAVEQNKISPNIKNKKINELNTSQPQLYVVLERIDALIERKHAKGGKVNNSVKIKAEESTKTGRRVCNNNNKKEIPNSVMKLKTRNSARPKKENSTNEEGVKNRKKRKTVYQKVKR